MLAGSDDGDLHVVTYQASHLRSAMMLPTEQPASTPAACGGRCARVDPGHPVQARAVDRMNGRWVCPASGVSMITRGATTGRDLQPKNLMAPASFSVSICGFHIGGLGHRRATLP